MPELNQLLLPFLSLVTLPELLRNPTVKDEASASGMTALNGLMLTYPVHQAADILFCKATLVPVGADQLPHVEQTRAIARRFNRRYAPECPVFPEPEALLSDAPVLLGTDGRKMSKSRNNAIALAATADRDRAATAPGQDRFGPATSPTTRRTAPRSPTSSCSPHCARSSTLRQVAEEIGSRGAAELKRRATEAVNERLRPVRDRRSELMRDRGYLRTVLRDGSRTARSIAQRTLTQVAAAMHTNY